METLMKKHKERITKASNKIARNSLAKSEATIKRTIISVICVFIIALLVVPPILVHLITSGHVDYGVIENHPLQNMYSPSDFGLTAKEMMLTTEDGYNVWASEVYTENPKAVIIYLSGIQQPSVTYYYGHAKWMRDNGYASFLLEVRGHGKSDGDRVCLGYEEVSDVKAVVDYIKRQKYYADVPIVIQGVSMGGSIAINAFGQIEDISSLIAASAYSSFEDVVADTMRSYRIPGFVRAIERPLIQLSLRFTFGDKVNELVPIKQVQNIGGRPALFIASVRDEQVSSENMTRLLAAAPEHCISWLRDEETAGHFIMLNYDFENIALDTEYCKRVLSFLENEVLK